MIKIKEFLSKTSSTLTNLFKKYPLTLTITIILTVFLTIFIEGNLLREEIIEKVTTFGIIWAISTLFIETLNLKKSKKITVIFYIVTAIISFAFARLLQDTYGLFNEHVVRTLVGYCLCLFVLTMYFITKKGDITFKEYILKIFNNIFHSSIIYVILNIGMTLILIIFTELILDGVYTELILKSQILLLGLFYFPAMLNAITNIKESKPSNFIKTLVKYVLIPLVTIAMVIIYIYIAKILIQREIPRNIIFRILAGIFIVAFPVWNMANNFKEDKFIYKISMNLPYVYLPFIFLEVYSLYARVIDFGITPIRYIGIMFIVFQIIVLSITRLKKKFDLNYTFIILSVLIFISCMTPLNYNTVSNLSQKQILKSNLKQGTNFENITNESKEKVYGAYKYLTNNNGKDYIPEYIKNMEDTINSYVTINKTYREMEYIDFSENSNEIDIKDYITMLPVKTDDFEYNDGNISLYDYNDNYITNINLKNIIEKTIEEDKISSEHAESYLLKNNYVHLNENQSLYITNINIAYNYLTNEVKSILLSGILLNR